MARYKGDVKITDIPGAEGDATTGVVLYPGQPDRRLRLYFLDDTMMQITGVSAKGQSLFWTGPGGIHLGSSLADVEKANGGSFDINGFGWDYGGYVTNLHSGKLSRLAAGCSLSLRFSLQVNLPSISKSLRGEQTLSSRNKDLRQGQPVLSEISINWTVTPHRPY